MLCCNLYFGTIGSAYILGTLGPKLLGGIDKVRKETKELEEQLQKSSIGEDPAFIDANRPVVFRAYKVDTSWFDTPRSISEIEERCSRWEDVFL